MTRSALIGKGRPTIAVDEQSKRVFVATQADDTVRVYDAARL